MPGLAPEGGWGWFVVASAFIAEAMWDGNTKALAVLLPTLREQFAAQTWMVGWVIGGLSTVLQLSGPVVGAISDNTNIDPRYIGMVGGVLTSFGFIAASISSTLTHLTLFVSISGGIGLGIAFIQSNALVPHYFDELYPRATGIITCGCVLGTITFAPLTQMFLDAYGWRGAVLLIGGINLHLIVSGYLLRPVEATTQTRYTAIITNKQHTKHPNKPIFILHMLLFCSTSFVYSGWFIYLVPHTISKGINAYQAATISSIAAVMSIIGRIGYAPLVEKNIVSIRVLMYAGSFLSAVSLLVDPWMNSFWSLMISSSAYWLGRGAFKALFFVILKENIGTEHLASGLGIGMALSAIFRAFGGAIVGWIYDYTGSYDLGFVLLGGAEITSIILLIIEDIYHRRKLKEMQN